DFARADARVAAAAETRRPLPARAAPAAQAAGRHRRPLLQGDLARSRHWHARSGLLRAHARLRLVGEAFEAVRRWREGGQAVALATVVATRRSAPRPLGSKLAISEAGELAGSVSGGCVESDVAIHAREVIDTGRPKLVSYGIADEDAWEVGLPCGGEIDVFLERF